MWATEQRLGPLQRQQVLLNDESVFLSAYFSIKNDLKILKVLKILLEISWDIVFQEL